MVDLTHRCNMECANCYLPNRDIPDMDVEKLIDLLQRLPRRTLIRLVGAEPTLRDDLCDIIRITRELGHSVSLITNGLKLARESYVLRLKEAGLIQVCISMNGADDDDIYRKLDNGKYAGVKTRALNNVLKHHFIVSTASNVARGVNEHVIRRQVDLMGEALRRYPQRLKPLLRFRTIGTVGRYMGDDYTYGYGEFIDVVAKQLGLKPEDIADSSLKAPNNGPGLVFEYQHCWIRLVDWAMYDDEAEFVDDESRGRLYGNYSGRITPDFKLAPFFLHVKNNEFDY